MKTEHLIFVGVAGVAAYLLFRDKLLNINAGTPYENTGIVGTAGNIANQASGGVLGKIGSFIGNTIFDLTHREYDPNA